MQSNYWLPTHHSTYLLGHRRLLQYSASYGCIQIRAQGAGARVAMQLKCGKMIANSIDGVIGALADITQTATLTNSRYGFFAYVYLYTTQSIQKAIEAKAFEDNERMERFDVIFANLYLQAFEDRRQKRPTRQAWQTAFEAEQAQLTIMQHVLLGMNAHINLDLGVAASIVMQDQDIQLLKADFMKVNHILADILDDLQYRLAKASPMLYLIDRIGGKRDEALINFSIARARDYAWLLAVDLASWPSERQEQRIAAADRLATRIAQRIQYPPSRLLRSSLPLIRFAEPTSVSKAIEALKI